MLVLSSVVTEETGAGFLRLPMTCQARKLLYMHNIVQKRPIFLLIVEAKF